MKKVLTAFVTLALVLMLVLTACAPQGSTGGKNDGESGGTPAPSGGSETSKEPFTVKMAIMVQTVPKEMDLVADAINELPEVKEANVKVDPLCISIGSWMQQMTLMMASGEKLDLRPVFSWNNELSNIVAKGQLIPIDDLLDNYGQGIKEVLGPIYSNSVRINGKLYGVPNLRDMACGHAVTFRKDLLEKYDIDVSQIKTYEDLTPIYEKVQAGEPGMVMTMNESGGSTNGMAGSAKGYYDDLGDELGVLMLSSNDTTVVNLYEQPEYLEKIKLFREWYLKGYTLPSIVTNQEYAVTIMKSGKLFSFLSTYKPGFDTQSARSVGMDVVCVPMQEPLSTTARVCSVVWAIPHNCEDPESAMKFLNLTYTSTDINNLLSWGIEGKHYVKTDVEGVIDYPQGVTATTSGYNMNMGWEFGNQLCTYVWQGDSPDLYKRLDEFNKSAKISKATGFIFDSSEVKNEIASCMNVKNQYNSAISSGCVDYETELPKYINALKAAGLDKIIAAKQEQLDDWLQYQQ
jgi:putative aldouronate transport system substrate-binding protein